MEKVLAAIRNFAKRNVFGVAILICGWRLFYRTSQNMI